jgi:hypothetical protein
LGVTQQIKYPKQITMSETHRILNPNQQAWIILLNGHLHIRTGPLWNFYARPLVSDWNRDLLGRGDKVKSRTTGKFPQEKRTNGFCCENEPSLHCVEGCWVPHRRVGW